MNRLWLAPICVCLLSGFVAADDDNLSEEQKIFKSLDGNSDGKVTEEEVGEEGKRLFKRLLRSADKNKDGQLTQDEFETGVEEEPKRTPVGSAPQSRQRLSPEMFFQRFDSNKDGKVTMKEIPAERKDTVGQLIKRGDKDGDEALSLEELKTLAARYRGQSPNSPNAPRPNSGMAVNPLMKSLDADNDGELSSEEISSAADALKKLDKNNDGTISRMELFGSMQRPQSNTPRAMSPENQGRMVEMILGRAMERDENNDGKLSKEEMPERMARGFSRIDADGDGFASREEIKSALSKMMERGMLRRPQSPKN